MTEKWVSFDLNLIRILEPKPGVYELADNDGMTIYIGGADNLLTCFRKVLRDPDFVHITQCAKKCHIEYRVDYMSEVQLR